MNKRLVWFIELFLWAALILALILGFTYKFATADEKNHRYYLFFKDVDGLAQGSPVRMMGFQIGYVRDVKVFGDNIFVSFLVTEKNVTIPEGSSAQVEFYGLGGSKSLEVVPPNESKNGRIGEVILTRNPYRVNDYYTYGKEINVLLESMMVNASKTLDAVTRSGITTPFLVKSTQKINSVLQSFVENDDTKSETIQENTSVEDDSVNQEEKILNNEETDNDSNLCE